MQRIFLMVFITLISYSAFAKETVDPAKETKDELVQEIQSAQTELQDEYYLDEGGPATQPKSSAQPTETQSAQAHIENTTVAPSKKLTPPQKIQRATASLFSGFKQTHKNCPLYQSTDSKSRVLIQIRAHKKLWLDQKDSHWFKAYWKHGYGYVERSCL